MDKNSSETRPLTFAMPAASPPPPAAAPQTLGPYRVLNAIGEGGMGMVYLGMDDHLTRRVAIKLISPKVAGDVEALERLRREAQAIAQVSHPNIVQVYAFSIDNGCAFIAMEYLEGEDLEQKVKREGILPAGECMKYMRQAGEALGVAARKGIIHRDIKPSNIFVTNDGYVKVMDFGLAKRSESDSNLTATGAVLGTPNYMSPEQARGSLEIDFHTDMYSLGCTLYTLMTGRRPFAAHTPMAAIFKHATEPLPIEPEWKRLAGGKFVPMLERLTAKEPSDRYATWDEAVRAMAEVERLLEGAPAAAPYAAPRAARAGGGGVGQMPLILGGGAIGLVVIGVGLFALLGGDPPRPITTALPPTATWTPRPTQRATAEPSPIPETPMPTSPPTVPPPPPASSMATASAPTSSSAPPKLATSWRPPQLGMIPGPPAIPVVLEAAGQARLANWDGALQLMRQAMLDPSTDVNPLRDFLECIQVAKEQERQLAGPMPPPGEPGRLKRIELAKARLGALSPQGITRDQAYWGIYLTLLDAPDAAQFDALVSAQTPPQPGSDKSLWWIRLSRGFMNGGTPPALGGGPPGGGRPGGGPPGGPGGQGGPPGGGPPR